MIFTDLYNIETTLRTIGFGGQFIEEIWQGVRRYTTSFAVHGMPEREGDFLFYPSIKISQHDEHCALDGYTIKLHPPIIIDHQNFTVGPDNACIDTRQIELSFYALEAMLNKGYADNDGDSNQLNKLMLTAESNVNDLLRLGNNEATIIADKLVAKYFSHNQMGKRFSSIERITKEYIQDPAYFFFPVDTAKIVHKQGAYYLLTYHRHEFVLSNSGTLVHKSYLQESSSDSSLTKERNDHDPG